MGMSQGFKKSFDNVVSDRGGGNTVPLNKISDFRLCSLIEGLESSISSKQEYIEKHNFPDSDNRYINKLEEEVEKFKLRLKELKEESNRRGLVNF